MRAARRVAILAIAAIVLVSAIFGAALVSSYQADAGTVRELARMEDVVLALRKRGLHVEVTGMRHVHPRLSVVGDEVQVGGHSVVIYVFPSVAERAAADQVLRSEWRFLAGESNMQPDETRIVAARNILLLHAVPDGALAADIYHAAGDVAS